MNLTKLTKKLISIPSYSDGKNFESNLTDFLVEYIKKEYPFLKIKTQKVAKNRYNIFATDGNPTSLLIVNHIDTVEPISGWKTNPFTPLEKNGKIYGLGSSDTKGNIAAFLSALKKFKKTKGLAILLYVDEEYEFKGMKHFIKSPLAKSISPSNILSIDGSGLELGIGCRGVIEFEILMKDKSIHSAKSTKNNLLEDFYSFFFELKKKMNSHKTQFLGSSKINIAKLEMGSKNNQQKLMEVGNRTPSELNALIEVRSTKNNLWETIKILNKKYSKIKIKKNLNENGFISKKTTLSPFIKAMKQTIKKEKYLNPKTFGYLDVAMLQSIYPKSVIASFGAGAPNQAHTANEYVNIKDLSKASKFYQIVIDHFCATDEGQ